MKAVKRVTLDVHNRFECPYRAPADPERSMGFFAVSCCEHPQRRERDGHPWCPDEPHTRSDDPTPKTTPFPPRCPL